MKTYYQLGFVLRASLGDCSNNGITSRSEHIYLFPENACQDDVIALLEGRRDLRKSTAESLDDSFDMDCERCFKIDRTSSGYVRAIPVFPHDKDKGCYMAGGNYIHGDSNFSSMVGHSYPISVHDRFESWEMYERMCI